MITIRINGRSIPAAQYLTGIRTAKANPDQTYPTSLHGWWPATGAEIISQYRADLQRRISQRGGETPRQGRVHPATWANAQMPRVILERHDIRTMNRSARRRLENRMRNDA